MCRDLSTAITLLHQGNYTCVLVKGSTQHTAIARGVKPLLDWLDSAVDVTGFSAADKVVGKAAAFLYVLLGVHAVHATVMSVAAQSILQQHGIAVSCDRLVEAIRNRTDTGFCPMEQATKDIAAPAQALAAIRATLATLQP